MQDVRLNDIFTPSDIMLKMIIIFKIYCQAIFIIFAEGLTLTLKAGIIRL